MALDPNTLYQEANCYLCLGITQAQALELALLRRQLLALVPNADTSVDALLQYGACYRCYSNGDIFTILKLALLDQIAQNSTGDGLIWGPSPETVDAVEGSADAVLAGIDSFIEPDGAYTTLSFGNPTTVTQDVSFDSCTLMTSLEMRLLETIGTNLDLNSSSALQTISFPALISVGDGLTLQNCTPITEAVFPSLVTVVNNITIAGSTIETLSLPSLSSYPATGITADATLLTLNLPACVDDGAGQLDTDINNMIGLTTLNLNSLTATTGNFSHGGGALSSLNVDSLVTIGANVSLDFKGASLSFPSLVTVVGNFVANSLAGLTSFSAPVWLPTDGTTIDFVLDGLDQTSVDHILARCVANPAFVSGTVDLAGGTNATPSAQGLIDAGILTGRGVTVITN